MIIATAGHVDHGKTSLVTALTGVDTDRLVEEKKRGLTIDLGFAYTDAETGGRLGFVDVPGHIKFINNMLAGVAAIDFALLVIAVDDGVMPQTIEHLEILNILGISAGAVALTKIDRASEADIITRTDEIRALLHETSLKDAEIFPVSAITGDGIEMLKLALDIAADDVERRSQQGCFRLAIDRSFNVKGSGIVVTGSVFSGTTEVAETLYLMPQMQRIRVRSLHTQNEPQQRAVAGDRCAINIASNDIELPDIRRGDWLTANPAQATDRVDISIQILSRVQKPFIHWTPVHVHAAANHVTGRVALLSSDPDQKTRQLKLQAGETGYAQLVLDKPINVHIGDRLVIRDQASMQTLGGGVVLDPYSPKRGRAKPERLALLAAVDPSSPAKTLGALLSNLDFGLSLLGFTERFNLTSTECHELCMRLDAINVSEDILISPDKLAQNQANLTTAIQQWHEANPAKAGLPLNQIHQVLARRWHIDLLNYVIRKMLDDSELEQNGNTLNRPGYGIQLSKDEQKLWLQIEPQLSEDPTKPPVVHDLAKSLNVDVKKLEKTLNQIVKTGQLIRPVKNRYFLPVGISELKSKLGEAADDTGQLTVQTYRDATGIGRNLCIEILEYFDRLGITRRSGDTRQIME